MNWPHRYYIFVPVAYKDIANWIATSIGPGGILENNTFGDTKLSPSGNFPETHYSCSFLATEEMRQAMDVTTSQWPEVPFIYYRLDSITSEIKYGSTESPSVLAAVSANEFWDWERSLADLGLIAILPPDELDPD